MFTLLVLLVIAGLALTVLSGAFALLLDPLIAIFIIWGIYKIVKMITKKK